MKRLFTVALVALICSSLLAQSQRQMQYEPINAKKLHGISLQDARYLQRNGARMGAQSIVIDPFSYDSYITADSGFTFEDNNFIDLNTNFQDNDQSLTFSMTWATQIFDTLLDINTLTGYPYDNTPVHLDSVDIVMSHENVTGTADTIIFTVYQHEGAFGILADFQKPGNPLVNTVLFSDTVITTTSLSPSGQYSLYTIYPDIDIPGNKKFVVGAHFYGSTQNTFGLRAGYADRCGASCVAYPSINQDNTAYHMVHWQQGITDLTDVYTNFNYGLVFDCNQNGAWGERNECEYMFIQNFWIVAYVTIDAASSATGCTELPSITASSCTPQQLPGPGFSDTSLCFVQGEPANTTIYFQNFGSISGITVEWIRIDSLTNVPCGLNFAMNDPDNTLITSENGCITFTGTTNSPAGTYQLGIWVTVKVSLFPTPISGEAGQLSSMFGGPPFGFFVVVNNPGEPCPGQVTEVNVSGTIRSELGSGVRGVTVAAAGGATIVSDTAGVYSLTFNVGESDTITPSKSNDISTNNGNTTLDILFIRRHILNTVLLGSPYKVIAADVNASNSVTTADILFIRSLILQITTSFPNGRLWAFVPDDYQFQNPQQPWGYSSYRTYSNLNADQAEQDFIGMKLGDVNNDWDPNISKTAAVGSVQLAMEEYAVMPQREIIIPVKVKDFKNVTGYQFTLTWNPEVLQLADVSNKSLNGYYGLLKAAEGFLTTSWDDETVKGTSLNDEEIAFELKFRAVGEMGSYSEIKINSELTASEAYNENLDLLNIVPHHGMVKVGDEQDRFHPSEGWNLSIQPNPFTNTTNIIFTLQQDETVTLTIYDPLGREVKQIKKDCKGSINKIQWDGADESGNSLSKGLYFIRMNTGNYTASAKVTLAR